MSLWQYVMIPFQFNPRYIRVHGGRVKLTAYETRSFRSLPPRTRIGLGFAVIAWGTIGLYISDEAEKKLGFEPTQRDKEALAAATPKVIVIDRDQDRD